MSHKSAFEIPQNYKIIKVTVDRDRLISIYNDPDIKLNNEKVLDYITKYYQGTAQFFDIDLDNGSVLVSWGIQRITEEAEIYNKKAISAAKSKNFEQAIDYWRKANYISKQDPDTLYNLALSYYETKNYTKALDRGLEVINNCPIYYRAYFLLGSIYSKMRKFQQAAEHISKGLIFQGNNATALVNLGAILSILKRNQEAIEVFERAIALSPNDIKAHFGLGKVFVAQNDVENANRCFKTVAKLDPNGKLGNIAKSSLLPDHVESVSSQAAADADEELKRLTDPNELYLRGYRLFLGCNYSGAAKTLRKYLAASSQDYKAWSMLSICQLRSGQKEEAISSITKALSLETKNAALYKQAGIIYDACGMPEESGKAARKAFELGKNDSVTLTLVGLAKSNAGQLQEGIRLLQDAVNKNPNNLKARFGLAQALYTAGQTDAAKQHWEEILWGDSFSPLKAKAREMLQELT